MKKRILVLALSLVLCVGMMPGMTLVASADSAITLPYSCDFSSEDSMSGWTVQGVDGTGINDGEFRFKWTTAPPQYLISPELPASKPIVFEFCYRASSSTWPEEFSVGYSTTTNATDQFTWGETISTKDPYKREYSNVFPAETKYVAIKHESYDQFNFYIDDISITTAASYNLWIGGEQVTGENLSGTGWEYAPGTNTLTLNNATITGPVSESVSDFDADGGIVYSGTDDFTINVTGGESVVTGGNTARTWSTGLFFGDAADVYGNEGTFKVNINISEGATLTLNGGAPTEEQHPASYGLCSTSYGDLTVSGKGTLNANGGSAQYSDGINTRGKLTIEGEVKVSGAGHEDAAYNTGITSSSGITINGGTVTATGAAPNETGSESYGIYYSDFYGGKFEINGGSVTATGTTAALNKAPVLGSNVTAEGSTDISGEGAVEYVAGNNNTYKWFRSSFTPVTNYNLWVNGIQVNSANAGDVLGDADQGSTVSFAPASDSTPATLTLNGAYLTSIGTGVDVITSTMDEPLTVVFKGTNIFNPTHGSQAGIRSTKALNIKGEESATLTMSNMSFGIDSSGGITIDGGTVNAEVFVYGIRDNGTSGITINGASTVLNVNGVGQSGIFSSGGAVAINNGKVTATGGNSGIFSGGAVKIGGGTVKAKGGQGSSSNQISGIYANGIAISGGDITAEGGSHGIYSAGGGITISGGEISAAGENGWGISAAGNDITISAGKVKAEGGTFGLTTQSYNDIRINGGDVEATGGVSGIYAVRTLYITNGKVKAVGDDTTSYGLYSNGVYISGGEVTATGVKYGVFSRGFDQELSVTGGKLTASGGEAGLFSNTSIPISGESTVVHATSTGEGQGVHSQTGTITVTSPLEIVTPKGGAVYADEESRSQYIAVSASNNTPAADVVIRKPDSSGGGSGGGGGGDTEHKVNPPADPENGSVTVSPETAASGTKVTITPVPEEGYEVDQVTVTDKKGKEIPVTDNGDGTYSFTMGSSEVNVDVTFAPAQGPDRPFVDVPEDAWFYDAVYHCYDSGYFKGVDDTHFAPQGTMTRAMFATVLYRIAGEPAVTGENPFTDVKDGQWYTDAVVWAAENKIIEGYGKGVFGTDDPVTREQMVTIFWRYNEQPEAEDADLSGFTDADQISSWAEDAFAWAVEAGVISGKGNGVLDPKGTATRAEVSQIVTNYDTKIG
ncbi:MAG: S-layer homology domain-containing protein [Firmicutes bacterium]|nr:S-layer homology domain-containing protein [Bacillota bacterium]